jgi:hypothetical protein
MMSASFCRGDHVLCVPIFKIGYVNGIFYKVSMRISNKVMEIGFLTIHGPCILFRRKFRQKMHCSGTRDPVLQRPLWAMTISFRLGTLHPKGHDPLVVIYIYICTTSMFLSASEEWYRPCSSWRYSVGWNDPVATPQRRGNKCRSRTFSSKHSNETFLVAEKTIACCSHCLRLGTIICSIVSDRISTIVQLRFATFKRIPPITRMSARKAHGTFFRMALS